MKRAIVLFLLLPVMLCCSAVRPSTEAPEIRVVNRSQTDYERVIVRFPSEEVNYGALGPGAASRYEAVDEAYRYAYIEVLVGGERLVMQPIDYVGETFLGKGRYTYSIGLDEDGDRLTLELEKD